MKQLFNTTTALIEAQIPEIKWIDFDFAQLEQHENPPVLFPCALITIGYPDSQPAGRDDRVTAELSIKLGFDVRAQGSNIATVQMKAQAQIYLDIFEKTLAKLKGHKPDGYTAFRFSSAQPQMLQNGIRTITINLSTRFTQSGT